MGIQGLHQRLKCVVINDHLQNYKGITVVVDASSWIHKALYSCSLELAMGLETKKYIGYILKRIGLLKHYNITPILVFDGRRVHLKAQTNEARKQVKVDNMRKGKAIYQESLQKKGLEKKLLVKKAIEYFQKCISPSNEVISSIINTLKSRGINFAVAPYEADAQMVWLCRMNKASAIITEDSDILVYCVATRTIVPVLFKLEDTGSVAVLSEKIIVEAIIPKNGTSISSRMFVQMCIFSGCDFLGSLPGVGIVTAQKLIYEHRGYPADKRITRILDALKAKGTVIPDDFLARFEQTEALFYHHVIYDEMTSSCRMLLDRGESFDDIRNRFLKDDSTSNTFLGEILDQKTATSIYKGEINAKCLSLIAPGPVALPGQTFIKESIQRRSFIFNSISKDDFTNQNRLSNFQHHDRNLPTSFIESSNIIKERNPFNVISISKDVLKSKDNLKENNPSNLMYQNHEKKLLCAPDNQILSMYKNHVESEHVSTVLNHESVPSFFVRPKKRLVNENSSTGSRILPQNKRFRKKEIKKKSFSNIQLSIKSFFDKSS